MSHEEGDSCCGLHHLGLKCHMRKETIAVVCTSQVPDPAKGLPQVPAPVISHTNYRGLQSGKHSRAELNYSIVKFSGVFAGAVVYAALGVTHCSNSGAGSVGHCDKLL